MRQVRFKEQFRRYVCEGDSIEVEHNGLTYRATIKRDDIGDSPGGKAGWFLAVSGPEKRGLHWPKSVRTLQRQTQRAKEVLDAWKKDEWFYCGIVLSVHDSDGDTLLKHAASLWGVDCNYPNPGRHRPNAYLNTVAGELLQEAIAAAPQIEAFLAAAAACQKEGINAP